MAHSDHIAHNVNSSLASCSLMDVARASSAIVRLFFPLCAVLLSAKSLAMRALVFNGTFACIKF